MSSIGYPKARRLDLVESVHGREVADPYRWLEDQSTSETQEWAQEQDELFSAARPEWTLREHFAERLTHLLAPGAETAPVWRGERRFLTRRRGSQEHGVLLTVLDGAEQVLLDPLALDPAGTTTLDAWQPSKEGDRLAYQLSAGGTEDSRLWVIDVASGSVLDGPIDRVRYTPIAWVPGGEQFYYVRRLAPDLVPADEVQFHRRVYLHQVGTSPDSDVEVFGTGLPATSYYGVTVSRDGQWLIVSTANGTEPRNDVWIASLITSNPRMPDWQPVAVGEDARTTAMVGRDGLLYVFTNLNAPRSRLAVTDPNTPTSDYWVDVIAQAVDAVLDDVAFLDDVADTESGTKTDALLVASWTRHAVAELTLHTVANGEQIDTITLPGLGSVGPIVEHPEGGHEVWFTYTDYVTPPTVFRFDATVRELSVWAAPPEGATAIGVHSQQIDVTSSDGTVVRAFVVSSAATPDRPRPTILYGYGGFRLSMTPGYSASALAWIEAGGVYVVASLRGGSEEGEQWHRDGMLANKQNVFDDFAALAEHLIATGWTTADQLSAQGGSNGGLLVGAALTQHPDLFASVVCSAPLLDMVRYEQFGLGRTWAPEYGTADKADEFAWLYAYSPYHHVTSGEVYPACLLSVFDGDTRVDPLHARKMTAALQYATASPRPILLRCEKDVGHSSRSLSRSVGLASDVLGFTAATTGLADAAAHVISGEGAS
jgi:prolyl oligopeptidase